MSRRNQAINGLVQGTGLYASLTKPQKKTLVAMLNRAYLMGQKSIEQEEGSSNGTDSEPEPGTRRLVLVGQLGPDSRRLRA